MGETDAGSAAKFWQSSLESLQVELRADGSGLDEASLADLERIVGERIDYYNRRRRHSALGNQTPLAYLESLNARR